jgi:hypothetical protein
MSSIYGLEKISNLPKVASPTISQTESPVKQKHQPLEFKQRVAKVEKHL